MLGVCIQMSTFAIPTAVPCRDNVTAVELPLLNTLVETCETCLHEVCMWQGVMMHSVHPRYCKLQALSARAARTA